MKMSWMPVLVARGDTFLICFVIRLFFELKLYSILERILSPHPSLKGECSISCLQRGVIFPTICLTPTGRLPYSYFHPLVFVFVSLYFMTNIKVINMNKYSREICYPPTKTDLHLLSIENQNLCHYNTFCGLQHPALYLSEFYCDKQLFTLWGKHCTTVTPNIPLNTL